MWCFEAFLDRRTLKEVIQRYQRKRGILTRAGHEPRLILRVRFWCEQQELNQDDQRLCLL